LKIGVPRERAAGERRVALVPEAAGRIAGDETQVLVETGAGDEAGFPDAQYTEAGATVVPDAARLYAEADLVIRVGRPSEDEIEAMRPETVLVALLGSLSAPQVAEQLAARGITSLSMDLVPRITRAQSMDVLSSQATVAGYHAVLLAAAELPRFFPLLMTAAGTVAPAKVLILGAGVAGLQAIATARRLGAVVSAFDVRPVVKEQVESLGATFLEIELPEEDAETEGGYAKELSEEAHRREQELVARHVAESDVVVTTALIPGRPAPILVTASMVEAMRPGSVIADLAADAGGNCELTEPGETVVRHGVHILGLTNAASRMPLHASQLYARNVSELVKLLVKDGELVLDEDDQVIRDMLLTRGGEVVHGPTRAALAPAKETT
jgi:H+-translocating NAD(P) transhydrogenase subunit alpha